MTITLDRAANHVRHALDGGDPDGLISILEMVNLTGEFMCSSYNWKWLQRRSVTADLVVDQDYVDLPADFREIVAIDNTAGLTATFIVTTLDELLQLRTSSIIQGGWHYRAAVSHDPPTAGGTPVPKLEIYPTPGSTVTDGVTIFYRAGWSSVSSTDSSHKALTMAEYCEPLYLELLRNYAIGLERPESQGNTSRLLAETMAGPHFTTAKKADIRIQHKLGPPKGGASAVGDYWPYRFNFGPLQTP